MSKLSANIGEIVSKYDKRHEEIPQRKCLTRTYKKKSYDMNFILFI